MKSTTPPNQHRQRQDESPIDIDSLRRRLPAWLQYFLPSGGGHHHREEDKSVFGFVIFLLSESIVFVSFFIAYIALRYISTNWLPPGIPPLELLRPGINTIVLVSSSFVIYFAEKALKRGKINKFRLLWLATSAMGLFFLIGTLREWNSLSFSITTGLFGATFYILTGFHALHVSVGILLQIVMLFRSFLPGNYQKGHFGITAASLFWHFVDIIWIILFLLVYVWRP